MCARWGGEEFVIAAPQTDLTGATALAEKLRETLSSSPFTAGETLTVSIGVTERISGEPLEQMMARVDKALYLAKANGRDRVEAISGD
ncbi:GGDEF domain-containing protein [Candidatus Reidiella endopervernicosa]|uniref:diguanylate cyclase n=1 Tax=Candidatus Reidiella endopervernicosa TaxID=2738883 RepID=A0A6N0I151_9GAMM|nr:GGDEF domain-containing protein [Solemya pervernicosa gill symbiont]QKQ28344.1 GGDEF domain-containing protein [Candidatus Reidiella endopervernicosa]